MHISQTLRETEGLGQWKERQPEGVEKYAFSVGAERYRRMSAKNTQLSLWEEEIGLTGIKGLT